MKLTFGDLKGKADAIQAHKDKLRFERAVDAAMDAMRNWIELPDVQLPNGQASIHAYPAHVRHIPLSVLREAAIRLRKQRDL